MPVGWRGEGVRSNRLDCWMPGTAPELILKPANQPWEARKSRAALPGCNSFASRRAVMLIHMLVTMDPRAFLSLRSWSRAASMSGKSAAGRARHH